MVRFIISDRKYASNKRYSIYIPIWLDLLYAIQRRAADLEGAFTFQYG